MEVAPALGCTEPAAVALCTAAAISLLPKEKIKKIDVLVDPNIYKNGLAVAIPGANGECGLALAAALGAICGDPELKLNVLESINDKTLKKAKALIQEKKVKVEILQDHEFSGICDTLPNISLRAQNLTINKHTLGYKKNHCGIYVESIIETEHHNAKAIIEHVHNNITLLCLDGKNLKDHHLISEAIDNKNCVKKMEKWLGQQSLKNMIDMLDNLDQEDYDFLEEGIKHNMRLADYGLKHGPGLGIGVVLKELANKGILKEDMLFAAKMLTSAASDARMSGVKLPAMSSAGSGNHGLTVILPIMAVKNYIDCKDHKQVLRAIALGHIITAYIKSHTGRLSAICGCSVAAGAGATAGITYLMGGNLHHISGAIKNIIEDLAGIICDGAKDSCALKLATAAGSAVQSALFSLHGVIVKATDGIICDSPEQCMKNVGTLSCEGMIEADKTILKIMVDKELSK